MNYAEIKDLLTSGFTPEQITQLATISGAIPSAPDSTPENATAPAVESPAEAGEGENTGHITDDSSPAEAEADPLEDVRQQLRALQEENRQLKEQVQSNNIRDRTVPTVSAPDASATLAEIIRPSYNHKGG